MFDLVARLRLQDDFSARMRKANNQMGKAQRETGKLSNGFKKLGGVLAGLGITVSAAAIAKSVISTGVTFDKTMSKVQAVTGATGEEMQRLRDQSKQLGRDTVHSASEAAEAQAFLGQAGFKTNEILASMPGLLDLASAGTLDLGNAADIASNVMSGFNLKAEEMGRISDVLAQAAASANTDVQQLGDGMSYVAPIASSMGIELEEVAAGIGIMSDAGIQGQRAGTALRGTIAALSDPTSALTKKLNAAGLSAEDVSPKFNSMSEIIANLEGAGFKASDALELVGMNAGPGLAALMTAGSEEMDKFTKELENSEGAAKRMADILRDNLGGAWDGFKSALEGVSIEIFEMAEPSMRSFVEWLTEITAKLPDLFEKAKPHLSDMKETLTGIVDGLKPIVNAFIDNFPLIKELVIGAAIAIGTFKTIALGLNAVSTVITVLGTLKGILLGTTTATWGLNTALLANPLTWVVVGIAAVVAAGVLLWRNWDTIKEKALELWDKMVEIFGNVGTWFAEKWNAVKDATIEGVTAMWNSIVETLGNIGEWFSEKWESVKEGTVNFLVSMGEAISEGFENIKQWIVDKVTEAFEFYTWVFTEMPFIAMEKLGFLVGTVVEWLSQLPGIFMEFFTSAVDWVITVLTELPGIIGGFLSSAWNTSVEWLSSIASSFGQWISTAVSNAVTWISQLPGKVGGFLSDTFSRAVEWLSNIASSFTEWFTTAYDNAINIVKEIPGKIAGYIGEIPGKVSGIISTVWDKFTELGSAIPKAIAGGFQKALGGLGKAAKWAIDKVIGGATNLANLGKQAASSFGDGYNAASDGSHFHGINRVPYDGYMAELHRGERILTRQEADLYDKFGSMNMSNVIDFPISRTQEVNNITKMPEVVTPNLSNVIKFPTVDTSNSMDHVTYDSTTTNNYTYNNEHNATNNEGEDASKSGRGNTTYVTVEMPGTVIREEEDVRKLAMRLAREIEGASFQVS